MLDKIKQSCKWFIKTMKNPYDWDEKWFIISIIIFGIIPVFPVYISAIIHNDMLFRFVFAYCYTILVIVIETITWLIGGKNKI